MKKKILASLLSMFMMIAIFTVNVSAENHNHTGWTNWGDDDQEKTSLPSKAGNYYLTNDVTLSSTWNVPGTTNLCLNGFIINTSADNFSVITISENSILNLYDCGSTSHDGYIGEDGLWHLGTGEGTQMNIVGGIITGGKAQYGGGVYNSGTFTMYGGNISGCVAENNGGGVYNKNTFNMISGSIQGCKALSNQSGGGLGGGVFNDATFTLSGGLIQNNIANRHGGGVQNGGSAIFNMTAGSIIYNTATTLGGGGINSDGNVTISGGTLANNKAKTEGGAIRFNGNEGKELIINGDTTITDNEASVYGGGIYNGGAFTMNGGTIANCKATDNDGGGVYNGGAFTMNGGTIANCEARANGGGVYNKNTFNMLDGSIKECKTTSIKSSEGLGGGVYNSSNATFVFSDGTIKNNIAGRHGGGIQNCGNASFNMTGGSIVNNIAPQYAGGINSDADVTILGGVIKNNTANSDGGGLRSKGTITLGKDVKIIGNTMGSIDNKIESNIYLYDAGKITIASGADAPTTMNVGITLKVSTGKFTTNGKIDDIQFFFSDDKDYKVDFNAGEVTPGDEYLELRKIMIADILEMSKDPFPTSTDDAWLNEKNGFMYIADGAPNSLLYGGNGLYVTNQLTKSGSNYSINTTSGDTLTFIMENDVLEKVIVEGAAYDYTNGTYMPQGVDYDITDGKQITININNGEDVLFTSSADFARFKEVKVDNVRVDNSNYTAVSGSTKVTLKASYLNTLAVGEHTIEILSNNGSATTTFTITKGSTPSPKPKYVVPKTGVE